MKLYEFIKVCPSIQDFLADWTIVLNDGEKTRKLTPVDDIENLMECEVLKIYWRDSYLEIMIKVPTELFAKGGNYYACFEFFTGATKKVPCNSREEAREMISKDYNPKLHRQIWTE